MMRSMRASAKYIMAIVAVAFVGWMVFNGPDLWAGDIAETEEEIRDIVSRYSPETNLDDEDEYYDALWESINDWQRDNFGQIEKDIINSRSFEID